VNGRTRQRGTKRTREEPAEKPPTHPQSISSSSQPRPPRQPELIPGTDVGPAPKDPTRVDSSVGSCSNPEMDPQDPSLAAVLTMAQRTVLAAENHLRSIAEDHISDPMERISETINQMVTTDQHIRRIFDLMARHTTASGDAFSRSVGFLLGEACRFANAAAGFLAQLEVPSAPVPQSFSSVLTLTKDPWPSTDTSSSSAKAYEASSSSSSLFPASAALAGLELDVVPPEGPTRSVHPTEITTSHPCSDANPSPAIPPVASSRFFVWPHNWDDPTSPALANASLHNLLNTAGRLPDSAVALKVQMTDDMDGSRIHPRAKALAPVPAPDKFLDKRLLMIPMLNAENCMVAVVSDFSDLAELPEGRDIPVDLKAAKYRDFKLDGSYYDCNHTRDWLDKCWAVVYLLDGTHRSDEHICEVKKCVQQFLLTRYKAEERSSEVPKVIEKRVLALPLIKLKTPFGGSWGHLTRNLEWFLGAEFQDRLKQAVERRDKALLDQRFEGPIYPVANIAQMSEDLRSAIQRPSGTERHVGSAATSSHQPSPVTRTNQKSNKKSKKKSHITLDSIQRLQRAFGPSRPSPCHHHQELRHLLFAHNMKCNALCPSGPLREPGESYTRNTRLQRTLDIIVEPEDRAELQRLSRSTPCCGFFEDLSKRLKSADLKLKYVATAVNKLLDRGASCADFVPVLHRIVVDNRHRTKVNSIIADVVHNPRAPHPPYCDHCLPSLRTYPPPIPCQPHTPIPTPSTIQ